MIFTANAKLRVFFITAIWLMTIVVDQGLKLWARTVLSSISEIKLFGGLFEFTLIFNDKGFLGVLEGLSQPIRYSLLLYGVGFILLLAFLWLYRRKILFSMKSTPLSLIIGGGISNIIDRLFHDGSVTDFIVVTIGPLRTGIFNFADVAILTGSFILGYLLVTPDE